MTTKRRRPRKLYGYVEEVSRQRMALAAHRLARVVEDLVGQVSP